MELAEKVEMLPNLVLAIKPRGKGKKGKNKSQYQETRIKPSDFNINQNSHKGGKRGKIRVNIRKPA